MPREHSLRSEELEAVFLPEAGARLHRLRAWGVDLLRTPADADAHLTDGFSWGAYVMAPWCNRAAPGAMTVAGRRVDLDANFRDGTAIHGLVSAAPWEASGDGHFVRHRPAGRDWPWPFEVSLRTRLDGPSLDLDLRLTNLDPASAMPAGLGLHPWFRRALEVRIPADRVYRSNTGSSPTPAAVDGPTDLRAIGAPTEGLDATWTSLGSPRLELAWPEHGIHATLEMETDAPSVLVALASLPGLDAIAVEPQTHGPDPLRRLAAGEPDPPLLLPRGATMRLALRLTIERERYR